MNKFPIKSNGFLVRLSLLLVVVISIIVVNSCRKDIKQSSQSAQVLADNKISITMLQKAYNKVTGNGKHSINDINLQPLESIVNSLNVDWTTYSIFTYPDSTQVVEFAMPDDTTLFTPGMPAIHDTLKYYTKTTAVFILRKDTISTQFFMKTIEDGTTPGYQSVINYLHYQQIPGTFTGNVLYFTFDRQFINGWVWDNGTLSKTLSFGATPQPPTTQNNIKPKAKINDVTILPCVIDTYVVYSYQTTADGEIVNEQDLYTFQVATCDLPDDNGSTGGSSSPPGGTTGGGVAQKNPCAPASSAAAVVVTRGKVIDIAAPLPGGGSGTAPAPAPVPCPSVTPPITKTVQTETITDDVTNPCLKSLIDNLANNNTIQTDVTKMLRNTFGVNDLVNVTFGQQTLTGNNSTDDAITTGSQKDNFDITFNTSQIANGSQEFLLETTMHEIFHAYLDENPTVKGNLTQHAYMIQNYINTEVQTLQAVFPKLSTHDAECIALDGYGTLDPTTLNIAIASYGLTLNDVVTTGGNYKSGKSGTKC